MLLLSFGCPFVSDSLRPHGLYHIRPPYLSPSPRVCPSSCSLPRWCHPAISSSDTLFSCPQSFPASGTFPMSRLFTSDDQNTGASASASVFPVSIQGWSPLRLIHWLNFSFLKRLSQHFLLDISIHLGVQPLSSLRRRANLHIDGKETWSPRHC